MINIKGHFQLDNLTCNMKCVAQEKETRQAQCLMDLYKLYHDIKLTSQ